MSKDIPPLPQSYNRPNPLRPLGWISSAVVAGLVSTHLITHAGDGIPRETCLELAEGRDLARSDEPVTSFLDRDSLDAELAACYETYSISIPRINAAHAILKIVGEGNEIPYALIDDARSIILEQEDEALE